MVSKDTFSRLVSGIRRYCRAGQRVGKFTLIGDNAKEFSLHTRSNHKSPPETLRCGISNKPCLSAILPVVSKQFCSCPRTVATPGKQYPVRNTVRRSADHRKSRNFVQSVPARVADIRAKCAANFTSIFQSL